MQELRIVAIDSSMREWHHAGSGTPSEMPRRRRAVAKAWTGLDWHDSCIRLRAGQRHTGSERAMDTAIDKRQIERVLSHLARLRHRGDQERGDTLDDLRPAWLGMDTWETVLEDLETEHSRACARAPRLQLVR
jgi:hypothetical protein